MQEGRKDRLLNLAVAQRTHLCLYFTRLSKLSFEDADPALPLPFVLLCLRHVGQLASRLRERIFPRLAQEHIHSHQWTGIPLLRIAQREGESTQDTACALEALQLCPLCIQDLGQIRVEGVTVQETVFCSLHILVRLLVQSGDTLHNWCNMFAERITIFDAFRLEEAAAQHLCHILFQYGLHRLFCFTTEDSRQITRQLFAQWVALQ